MSELHAEDLGNLYQKIAHAQKFEWTMWSILRACTIFLIKIFFARFPKSSVVETRVVRSGQNHKCRPCYSADFWMRFKTHQYDKVAQLQIHKD